MPKSLYSSRECPDSMADRLAAHRFGVFACTVLTVFGSLWISNAMSVREEERVLASALEAPGLEGLSQQPGQAAPAVSGDPLRYRELKRRSAGSLAATHHGSADVRSAGIAEVK